MALLRNHREKEMDSCNDDQRGTLGPRRLFDNEDAFVWIVRIELIPHNAARLRNVVLMVR